MVLDSDENNNDADLILNLNSYTIQLTRVNLREDSDKVQFILI